MNCLPIRTKIALGCFVFIALAAVAVGLRYSFSPRIMPYHQQALGMAWDDLGPRERGLLLALLRGTGLGALVMGGAVGTLLIPYLRGERWARWAIAGLSLTTLAPASWIAFNLAHATGATTPWPALVGGVVVVLVGFGFAGPALRGDGTHRKRSSVTAVVVPGLTVAVVSAFVSDASLLVVSR